MGQINIGNIQIDKFYLGDSSDVKIYLGNDLLYPNSYKFIGKYGTATEYKIACDSATALTSSDVTQNGAITALTSAEVGSCITRIETNAFSGATSMSSIVIDNSVTVLGNQAFYGCSSLTSFNFPNNLTKIEGACFRFANRITNLNVPNGVELLQSGCFADMSGLTAATIPASVTQIDANLFLRDSALKEVHFLGSTAPTIFKENAFKDCTSLEKIYIPTCDCYNSYATTVGMSAFTNYIYAEDNTKCLTYTPSVKITTVNGWSHIEDSNGNTTTIVKSASKSSDLTTCTITISGVTNITFTQKNAVSGSGIEYSSSVDNFTAKTQVRTVGKTWGLTNLDPSKTYTIKCRLLQKNQGQYITGTNAGANITWS